MDVEFVGQLVDSMSDAVSQLDRAVEGGEKDEANRLRTFVFDLHGQIAEAMGVRNEK